MRKSIIIMLVLLLSVFLLTGFADEKPAEEKKADEKKAEVKKDGNAEKIKFEISFGIDLSGGNTEALGVNADVYFNWKTEENTNVVLSSKMRYLESNGEQIADKIDLQLLFDYMLGSKVTMFVYGKPSRDLNQQIDLRVETAGGLKYDIVDNYRSDPAILNTDLSISAAMVYEITNREEAEEAEKLMRLSLRPKFKKELGENLELELEFFWQPSISDFDDYRMLLNTKLAFKVSKSISFLLSFESEYNSIVPAGVEKQDYRLLNQIKINF
ncbi:MAG: DUF481 domain-containing protein [Acidobacteria bacterium]|nr:DUF481 domain-containing protein [Acidobacteriota bacterium]